MSEHVVIGKTCSLNNILDFINKAESTVEECSFMVTSTLPRNLTFLDQVQCNESTALNLSTIQSNLTLLSSNAASVYMKTGRSHAGRKHDKDLGIKGKIPYQKETNYRNYERNFSNRQDYSFYQKNKKMTDPVSGDAEMRGRSKYKGTARGTRSMNGSVSRSPSGSLRSNSRSRSRSAGRSRSRSADKQLGCVRCGSKLHQGKMCTVFPYCETRCRVCDNYHRTHLCNRKKSQKVEANVANVERSEDSEMSSNYIDVDWATAGNSGGEALFTLTSLPEWNELP